jgi:hypothetical protein
MMQEKRARHLISSSSCDRHHDRRAEAHCQDCNKPLCGSCGVDVPGIGTLCSECAMRRGGLHHGPRSVYVEQGAPAPRSGSEPSDAELAVRRFEAHVRGREPHHLISGLTERLVDAGADPEDVIDDEAVIEEIDRLQALARTDAERRGWRPWARRRDERPTAPT